MVSLQQEGGPFLQSAAKQLIVDLSSCIRTAEFTLDALAAHAPSMAPPLRRLE